MEDGWAVCHMQEQQALAEVGKGMQGNALSNHHDGNGVQGYACQVVNT